MSYSDLFLREFTKQLIINSSKDKNIKKLFIPENQIPPKQEQKYQKETTNEKQFTPSQQIPQITLKKQFISNNSQNQTFSGINKFNNLLNDKSLTSIECPGPGKFIIIRKINKSKTTNIVLNKTDINNILNDFSEQSRIPRIGGVFRAIINGITINAIDTDIGGPKFIITRSPRL